MSRFWTTPAWRRVKTAADRVLLFAVVGAVAWAATNGAFVAQRAAANRGIALVHLSGQQTVLLVRTPGGIARKSLPTSVLRGTQTQRISIAIANDGPDGVTLKGGTLSGPYLVGDAQFGPGPNGYISPTGTVRLIGTVTVDCDATARMAGALVAGVVNPERQTTTLAISVADANGSVHHTALAIDTTAFAIQGKVCTA